MTKPLFIIAEAGVNHNGRLDLALQLVDVAAAAGADAVKFQTFRAESLVTRAAPMAGYQKRAPVAENSQFEMLKKLELDEASHWALAGRCSEKGIEFMSTPFDVESVTMLNQLGVQRFKVPSGEIDNPLLLRAVAITGKPLIVSSGMATLGDLEFALRTIASAVSRVDQSFWTEEGAADLAARVTLLHCTTEYPAPPESVNLLAMRTMADAFKIPVGYSDHTEGFAVSIAAVALGATVIEKHFTLDRQMPGPDHAASLEAKELQQFVDALRAAKKALIGDGRKVPSAAEIPNRAIARRSVVAKNAIRKGEILSLDNLALKRPGHGIPASRIDELVGTTAQRDYAIDEMVGT